ncbi:MAG: type IV toxin-antitoxin system AbiEi family antitoxin domain-containing protein [Solirubrobacterales bacterium]|nr:type IV toxin-antitoxin system AbiEi family antitoxin domain-containing protein [Solirubrobacterales bacterium]
MPPGVVERAMAQGEQGEGPMARGEGPMAQGEGPVEGEEVVRGDRAVARIAASHHGVVTRSQLTAAGLGRGAIAHRLAQGRLHRLHLAVFPKRSLCALLARSGPSRARRRLYSAPAPTPIARSATSSGSTSRNWRW